jgi:hypothetical protein
LKLSESRYGPKGPARAMPPVSRPSPIPWRAFQQARAAARERALVGTEEWMRRDEDDQGTCQLCPVSPPRRAGDQALVACSANSSSRIGRPFVSVRCLRSDVRKPRLIVSTIDRWDGCRPPQTASQCARIVVCWAT